MCTIPTDPDHFLTYKQKIKNFLGFLDPDYEPEICNYLCGSGSFNLQAKKQEKFYISIVL